MLRDIGSRTAYRDATRTCFFKTAAAAQSRTVQPFNRLTVLLFKQAGSLDHKQERQDLDSRQDRSNFIENRKRSESQRDAFRVAHFSRRLLSITHFLVSQFQ